MWICRVKDRQRKYEDRLKKRSVTGVVDASTVHDADMSYANLYSGNLFIFTLEFVKPKRYRSCIILFEITTIFNFNPVTTYKFYCLLQQIKINAL